jgi:hypothetical protein
MSCFMSSWFRSTLALVVAASFSVSAANAQIIDDFSDLNDTANPAWFHLGGNANFPTGGNTLPGQTWDASTGQYHLSAPNNGYNLAPYGQLGFIGARLNDVFTDTLVRATFVGSTAPAGVGYGLLARANASNGFNALQAYQYSYDVVAGEMILGKINGLSLSDNGSQAVVFDFVNKDYTFELGVNSTTLYGRVYEVGGGIVASKSIPIGDAGAVFASGRPGVWGYSAQALGAGVDYTIDNFEARVPEPGTGCLIACGMAAVVAHRRRLRS